MQSASVFLQSGTPFRFGINFTCFISIVRPVGRSFTSLSLFASGTFQSKLVSLRVVPVSLPLLMTAQGTLLSSLLCFSWKVLKFSISLPESSFLSLANLFSHCLISTFFSNYNCRRAPRISSLPLRTSSDNSRSLRRRECSA